MPKSKRPVLDFIYANMVLRAGSEPAVILPDAGTLSSEDLLTYRISKAIFNIGGRRAHPKSRADCL